ncbi:hypothetical protein FKW77_003874 [Venturia effusa]|uniref:J domain-containing protein n=1 Tax=Venturia effusa TaxID=50376 RepID=A0A517LAS1_9PEZI|nr:hypothetical protein FKW77_003874 [Venturia effusa]
MDPKVSQSYAALGLPSTADRTAVKTEYRRLALLHHPDKIPAWQKLQAQEDMEAINAAYETLGGYLDWKESSDRARAAEREAWGRKRREKEERMRKEREAEAERVQKMREEREKREWEEKCKKMEEEMNRGFAESRREYLRIQQEKAEEERKEREKMVDGEEEVRKMKAAWQQQYAEAGIWLAEKKKAPAGASAVVVVEEEKEDEDVEMEMEMEDAEEKIPSDGKIRFSLRNLKK